MTFLSWLVLGGLSGWMASMIMGTNARQGMLGDIVLGIIGAFLGGFLFNIVGLGGASGFNIWSLFVSVVGALGVMMAGRALTRS